MTHKKRKLKIVHVVGARPNFMKIAPLLHAAKRIGSVDPILVHTGQHYDENLSDVFFQDLDLPKPDVFLGAARQSKEQFADIFMKFNDYLSVERPGLVVVVGDVTSTAACAVATKYAGIKLAHVESGLRSFDLNMPEERNRILIDGISDYLFVTEPSGVKNLIREGISKKKIYLVGNVMIDSLIHSYEKIMKNSSEVKLGLRDVEFGLVTLHRPSNVDSLKNLRKILAILKEVSKSIRLVFPVHPRTKSAVEKFGIWQEFEKLTNVVLVDPLGYVDFVSLMGKARFILTDSGGIQEEATFLNVPCLTMRDNTERPITVEKGTNMLVGLDKKLILDGVNKVMKSKRKKANKILYWDGNAGERIYKIMIESCGVDSGRDTRKSKR